MRASDRSMRELSPQAKVSPLGLLDAWGNQRVRCAAPRSLRLAASRSRRGCAHSGTAKTPCQLFIGDVLAYLNESGLAPDVLQLAPDALAELVDLVADGTLSRGQAKDVLAECLSEGKRPKQVVEERGLAQLSDEAELGTVIDGIIAGNPTDVEEYRNGDDKVRKKKRGFFMGEAMKATKGQGNPQLLNRLLDDRLGG